MNRTDDNIFVETLEYRRFAEFCDACRHCQYIGLCYRSPVVAKTLSARRYSLWDRSRRDVYKVEVAAARPTRHSVTAVSQTPCSRPRKSTQYRLLCRNSLFEFNYMTQREKTMASLTPQWGITAFCEQL